jgi:hypothetical protein
MTGGHSHQGRNIPVHGVARRVLLMLTPIAIQLELSATAAGRQAASRGDSLNIGVGVTEDVGHAGVGEVLGGIGL